MTEYPYARQVAAVVATFPPLTNDQRERIEMLVQPTARKVLGERE